MYDENTTMSEKSTRSAWVSEEAAMSDVPVQYTASIIRLLVPDDSAGRRELILQIAMLFSMSLRLSCSNPPSYKRSAPYARTTRRSEMCSRARRLVRLFISGTILYLGRVAVSIVAAVAISMIMPPAVTAVHSYSAPKILTMAQMAIIGVLIRAVRPFATRFWTCITSLV